MNFGDSIATESGIEASTPYEALAFMTKLKGLELKVKQYDFGVFIEKIGDKANTTDNAWIYFVNGKSAQTAADKVALVNGDTVEWRYTKPIY